MTELAATNCACKPWPSCAAYSDSEKKKKEIDKRRALGEKKREGEGGGKKLCFFLAER